MTEKQFLKLFGDGTRGQVLDRIVEDRVRGVTVAELADDIGVSENEIEDVVSDLRDAGAVTDHQDNDGLTVNQRSSVGKLLKQLDHVLVSQQALQADFDTLSEQLS